MVGDGIGWVLRTADTGPETEIARYAKGALVTVATGPRLHSLTAVSGGRACAFDSDVFGAELPGGGFAKPASAIVCYDADGEFARIDVAGRVSNDSEYSVAPDGAVWLLGPQVARLPQTLPAE